MLAPRTGLEYQDATIALAILMTLRLLQRFSARSVIDSVCGMERTADVGPPKPRNAPTIFYLAVCAVRWYASAPAAVATIETSQRLQRCRCAPRAPRVAGWKPVPGKPALLDIASIYRQARSCDRVFPTGSAAGKFLRNLVYCDSKSARSRMNVVQNMPQI